ncbi:uncharacterized protein METZ01_LOCUS298721, partial [marine metagenome]
LTYNTNILKGLLDENDNNEYYVFTNEELIGSYAIPISNNIHLTTISEKYSRMIPRYIWMQTILLIYILRRKIDVLFSPMNIMPILLKFFNIRSVLVIHSNLPWLYPKDVPGNKLKLLIQKLFTNLSIKISDKIIVDSKTAKKELTRIFPTIIDKTIDIYLGLDKNRFIKKKGSVELLNNKIDINKDKYFLSISGAWRYHCLKELIIAYDNFRHEYKKGPKFLLITKNTDQQYFNELNEVITTRNFSEDIILIEDIDSDLIPLIYSNADLYIFSSYCEVFGFTNLEAMSCGVPVLTSNKSAMPEICGEAALYFNPNEPADITNKIVNLYLNKKLRSKMIMRGYKRISKYSWQNTCAQTKFQILRSHNN